MGLQESLANDTVSDFRIRQPVLCKADEGLRQVIERMRGRSLGCAIVVDGDNKPVGMLTESMLTQLVADDPTAVEAPIRDHMAETWPWVLLSDPAPTVMEAMLAKNTRFLCVLDDDGRIVGLTGQKGLMEYIADHFPKHVMVQRVGSRPPAHREGA